MQYSPMGLAIEVASAVSGCLATSLVYSSITGKPASIIAGDWRQYAWSVLFALPAVPILQLDPHGPVSLLVLVVWLIVAPTIAAKFAFRSKDGEWQFLLMLHSAFAFTTLASIVLLSRVFGLS
jgi:hypothetical protein